MLKKAVALFLVFAGIALCTGCGKTASRYLYAAIPTSSEIVAFREDPNSGVLTALVGSPITAGPAVQAVALHPSKKFLYAANSFSNDISLFTIDSGGGLTEVTPRTSVAPNGTTPALMVMDSAGKFLYVGNTGSSNISVFSIDASSGALTPVANSPFLIGTTPLNIKLSPSGSYLYVTAGPGTPGSVEVFTVSAGGSLSFSSLTNTGTSPYGLAIDPSGTYLYTANFGDNSISEFTINSDGSLTELSGSPVGGAPTISSPLALLVDNSGKYLYVANSGTSSNLAAYAIGSDGGLTLLTNSPFITNSGPNVIASDPSGKYLFVGNQKTPEIQSFSLDPSSGTLTSVGSYPVPNTPTSIAISK
jgi:6-phosphogluconolactonase (cycloisomerase 2 family)